MGSFPKFLSKLYFEILMDGCSKNSSSIFSRTQMDTSEPMKKNMQKCLDHLVDFQIAFKMFRKTIGTKAQRNDRY